MHGLMREVWGRGSPWAKLHALLPHASVVSPDLFPASLFVPIGSKALRSLKFCQSQEDTSILEQESHWPRMGHMTISDQLLRARSIGLL